MTITSKSTDGQNRELSLTELDQVSGGLSALQKAALALAVISVVATPAAYGSLFLLGLGLGAAAKRV